MPVNRKKIKILHGVLIFLQTVLQTRYHISMPITEKKRNNQKKKKKLEAQLSSFNKKTVFFLF